MHKSHYDIIRGDIAESQNHLECWARSKVLTAPIKEHLIKSIVEITLAIKELDNHYQG